jgi:hypothetical protein
VYDSVFGRFRATVVAEAGGISVDGDTGASAIKPFSAAARASSARRSAEKQASRPTDAYVDSIYREVKSAIQDAIDRLATQRASRSSASV